MDVRIRGSHVYHEVLTRKLRYPLKNAGWEDYFRFEIVRF